MNKQFVMALIASGALVGLGGCSEGDTATINIEAPTTDNSVGGDNCSGDSSCSTDSGTGTPVEPPVADACPTGTTQVSTGVCSLSGRIVSDMTLVAGNEYQLDGRVIVGNGNCELADANTCTNGDAVLDVTLTIEAGVEVKGLP